MLLRLEAAQLAILEQAGVEFGPGLNVLTGETGAGKSLLLDALQLALGGRATPDLVRSGAPGLRVDALFAPGQDTPLADRLRELQAGPEDGTLLLTRELAAHGRSACRVNGRLTTASGLRDIGAELIALVGQGAYHRLALPATQLDYLDGFGGLAAERAEVQAAHARWRSALSARRRLGGDAAERDRHREALEATVADIDALQLTPGAEERLEERRRVLGAAERLLASARHAMDVLREGEAAVGDQLGEVARDLGASARLDPRLAEPLALVEQAGIAVQEAGRALAAYLETVSDDPKERAAVEAQWDRLQRCKHRYGGGVEQLLATRERAGAELTALDAAGAEIARLEREIGERAAELGASAARLGAARRAAALRLEEAAQQALADLGMPDARLAVRLEDHPDDEGVPVGDRRLACGALGCESVEFLWSANAGEPPAPLGRAASGGELSRLLLALHALRAEGVDVPTLVFDEVDAGVGGRAAAQVAERLHLLACRRQVLCVTHLAVVAAAADQHFVVDKRTERGRTVAVVRAVTGEERVAELARMLDGAASSTSLRHAREMLGRQPAG